MTAGAVERIDRVAAVDAPAAQRRLLNAIARFDQEARETAGARWLDLSDTARLELLTRAAAGATGQQPQPAWTRGQPVVSPTVVSAPPTTLRDHLDLLKAVIGGAVHLDRSRDDRARMDRALVLARAARLHA